ncbi:MAG: helix-turn-helix domain-containing protein [Acidaminococcus sp.]|nr:helix-turn-helix domain-containing protein [Acidaminococcus sp.]
MSVLIYLEYTETSGIAGECEGKMEEVNYSQKIGEQIRKYRKQRGLSLQNLSQRIHKGHATLSKYESGQIIMDVNTLYDIAHALHVRVEQLIYAEPVAGSLDNNMGIPKFFQGVRQFYMYYYDGRINAINRSVVDILERSGDNTFRIMMYMNISDYASYLDCEHTFSGVMQHFDSLTNMHLVNRDTPMDELNLCILATYLDEPKKWGMVSGVSSRPLMPTAARVLVTKVKCKENKELIDSLKISKDDIKKLKLYNMLVVT